MRINITHSWWLVSYNVMAKHSHKLRWRPTTFCTLEPALSCALLNSCLLVWPWLLSLTRNRPLKPLFCLTSQDTVYAAAKRMESKYIVYFPSIYVYFPCFSFLTQAAGQHKILGTWQGYPTIFELIIHNNIKTSL